MKRLIAISVGLVWSGAALAADPVRTRPHTAPAATLRTVGATDVTQPLPAAVSTALPPAGMGYPVPHGTADCGGACPSEGCVSCGRTCLEKLTDWFCYRPGPRVLPLCTPVPYQTPLRHYFPCHPGQCLVVGGCNPGAGCASGGCGHAAPGVGPHGTLAPAATGAMPAPHAVPTPVGTVQGQTPIRPARPTFRARVMGVFSSMWSDPAPDVAFQSPESTSGPTVVPAPTGHRFAAPGVQKPANGTHGGLIPAGHQQPSANRPLTKQ